MYSIHLTELSRICPNLVEPNLVPPQIGVEKRQRGCSYEQVDNIDAMLLNVLDSGDFLVDRYALVALC